MTNKKVMVAYDGSDGSIKALKKAIQNHSTSTELTVVTVISGHGTSDLVMPDGLVTGEAQSAGTTFYPYTVQAPPVLSPEKTEELRKQRESEIRQEGEKVLATARDILKEYHIHYKMEVLHGNVPERICEYAEVNDMDEIVVGHRGLSGLKKLFLGSVSQKIVQEANCPILVVK